MEPQGGSCPGLAPPARLMPLQLLLLSSLPIHALRHPQASHQWLCTCPDTSKQTALSPLVMGLPGPSHPGLLGGLGEDSVHDTSCFDSIPLLAPGGRL